MAHVAATLDVHRVVRKLMLQLARAFDLAARACSSLAATTLRMRDLRSDTEQTWGRFSTRDEDIDVGLFLWEEQLFQQFVRPGHRILVVGCGTGRDVVALAARRHQVTGVEPAPAAAALACATVTRRGIGADIIQGYFEDVAVPGAFDIIVFSFMCYGYIPESRRRIEVLRKAKTVLTPGGTILVSYAGNRQRRQSRLMDLTRSGTRVLRSDWRPEPGDVVQPMLVGEARFHYEHLFIPGEIEAEIAAAGLRVIFHDEPAFDPWVVALGV